MGRANRPAAQRFWSAAGGDKGRDWRRLETSISVWARCVAQGRARGRHKGVIADKRCQRVHEDAERYVKHAERARYLSFDGHLESRPAEEVEKGPWIGIGCGCGHVSGKAGRPRRR